MDFWKGLYGLVWRIGIVIIAYVIFINMSFTVTYNSEKGISLLFKNMAWLIKQGAKILR